jgi:cytochrome c
MSALRPLLALAALAFLAGCAKKESGPAYTPVLANTPQEALASLPAPYNAGDVAAGRDKFSPCRSCHTLTEGGPNGVGPNLWGIFGRKAGTGADYTYSDVVKTAGFTWDADHLNKWLSDPKGFMPGTKMTFKGYPDQKDRTDLIAFLKVETGTKSPPAP